VTGGIAALPMYDWPGLRAATDGFWARVRDGLRRAGVDAPDALTRDIGLLEGWTHPALVLGQACGLPFVGVLRGRVALVGAPDHGLPGCPAGWYRSAVVVRADDPRQGLADFRGARLAINGTDSQSGWGAVLQHAAPLAERGGFFGGVAVSGAHAASVSMVATGGADLAAIDAVSWRYARRFLPEAARLRVLMQTDPTPGLPYIAARGTETGPHTAAIAGAIGAEEAGELGLVGFARLQAGDYAVVAERFALATGALPGDVALAAAASGGGQGRSRRR
jgi:hypothetical protein